jgi:hypothetical protein
MIGMKRATHFKLIYLFALGFGHGYFLKFHFSYFLPTLPMYVCLRMIIFIKLKPSWFLAMMICFNWVFWSGE